jgi:hypothetical protein
VDVNMYRVNVVNNVIYLYIEISFQ